MQHNIVGLIGDGAQIGDLVRAGIGKQGKAVIGMGGHDHLIEHLPSAIGLYLDAHLGATHRLHRTAGAQQDEEKEFLESAAALLEYSRLPSQLPCPGRMSHWGQNSGMVVQIRWATARLRCF